MTRPVPTLAMEGIDKSFPGVKALEHASLSVLPGEIHGLVGENGAGKSTIIKVLAGIYQRDAGEVRIDGSTVDTIAPGIVHEMGIRFIHQELNLVPHFTVAESVFMGQERNVPNLPWLDTRGMRRAAERFLEETLHVRIDGSALIRDLGIAERKLVQIARALIDGEAKLVVFDEPTAPLAAGEIDELFRAIRRLKASGIAMIYVSHYLGEITDICDAVTVFRNGADVEVIRPLDAGHTDRIIQSMVGRGIGSLFPEKADRSGKAAFTCTGLGDGEKFEDVGFEVGEGEILGIAGLIGSGREELVDAIYGLRRLSKGLISIDEKPARLNSPAEALARGVALVPRNRRDDGLVLDMTVADNVNLGSLEEVARYGLERRGKARERAADLCERLDIRPRQPEAITRFLSGGNQQKTVLARWLATGARVFILDEPTVGVDIGAKVEIYQLVENLARRGTSIIVSSSDSAELLGLCDRIVVMLRGRVVAVRNASSLTLDTLLAITTGGQQTEGDALTGVAP